MYGKEEKKDVVLIGNRKDNSKKLMEERMTEKDREIYESIQKDDKEISEKILK